MKTRRQIEEGLRRANRCVKRWLGVENRGAVELPPPPFHLAGETGKPVFSETCERGTFVFLLQHASRGSGGLADILCLGVELAKTGLKVSYVPVGGGDVAKMTENILWTNDAVRREQVVSSLPFVPEYVCATAWPTAYKALAQPSRRKLYFVQDYEPWFHPAGVSRWYAERTYELGLEMFTLGPWLTHHLRTVHDDVRVTPMPFPAGDSSEVGRTLKERRRIAFYLQPDKEHRGTELVLETASRLSSRMQAKQANAEIVLFGSPENEYLKPGFPCTVLGVLGEAELTALFRKTRVGFCASFTNVSLVTFRYLSSGCLAVDLDLPNVTKNIPGSAISLIRCCPPDPESAVEAIEHCWDFDPAPGLRERCVRELAEEHSWLACAGAIASLFNSRTHPSRSI